MHISSAKLTRAEVKFCIYLFGKFRSPWRRTFSGASWPSCGEHQRHGEKSVQFETTKSFEAAFQLFLNNDLLFRSLEQRKKNICNVKNLLIFRRVIFFSQLKLCYFQPNLIMLNAVDCC